MTYDFRNPRDLVQALGWNAQRNTVLTKTRRLKRPEFVLCSRHSSVRAAHVTRAKLRVQWPDLEFQVKNLESDFHTEWGGEIYCRWRGEETA